MPLTITKNGSDPINAKKGTVKITKELDHRGFRITFTTEDSIEEWDEIVVADGSGTLFAGIVEKIQISSPGGSVIERQVISSGYKRLFDMKRIAFRYEGFTAGDIVKDIIANWTEDFTEGTIEDGATFETVVFNYKSPSDAITQLANSIGFLWRIDNDKNVHFYERTKNAAPQIISDTSGNFRNIKLIPDVSELTNSIIIRGGTYLSTTQSYKEVGDGEKTQFILPEKPRDVSVEVNGVPKTIGVKIEGATATTDFVLSFQEKYVENGTHATLTTSDTLEVFFKYDVPLRIRRRDLTSIATLEALFPDTDGIFEKVINDDSIDSRELANQLADEQLNLFANATIKGTFNTYETVFEPGEVITINAKGISKTAVIEKVQMKSIANGFFECTVSFATVLFDFEDFLRKLLTRGELDLNESETVENIVNVDETITLSETVTATVDANRITETITMTESVYNDLNFGVQYVYGEYFPSAHTDTKRVGIFDASTYG